MTDPIRVDPEQVAAHLTLTANDVYTVVFDAHLEQVEIVARDGAADCWYTINGPDPTVQGPNCFVLPAGVIGSDSRHTPGVSETTIRFMSPGTPGISVQRVR